AAHLPEANHALPNNGLAFGPGYDIIRSEEIKGTKERKVWCQNYEMDPSQPVVVCTAYWLSHPHCPRSNQLLWRDQDRVLHAEERRRAGVGERRKPLLRRVCEPGRND